MKHLHFLLFIAIPVLLCIPQCSHQNTAGVISETTNGVCLAGKLLGSDGRPLSGASVTLRSIESFNGCSNNFEMVTFSNSGSYAFNSVPVGIYVVHAFSKDSQAAAITVTISQDSGVVQAADLAITSTVTETGIVAAPPDAYPLTIAVCGTAISTISDMTGRYTLSHLPKVDFLFRLSSAKPSIPPLVIPSAMITSVDTFTYDTIGRTLIDDFNDGDGKHLLAPFLSAGHWYERHESGMSLLPAVSPDDLSSAITSDGSWRSKSMVIRINNSGSGGLFIVACELGSGLGTTDDAHRWFDLSCMTSFTFAAKGEGMVHVAFLTRKIYTEYSGADHFEKVITLSPEWTLYSISASELLPPEGSDAALRGESWQSASAYVAEISFFSDNVAIIGLDDLCINGVTPIDFIRSGIKR